MFAKSSADGPHIPASMTSYLASPPTAFVALCPRHPLRRRWPPPTSPEKMHRSASTTRASDEFFLNVSPPAVAPLAVADQLPTYNPLSDASKKEASRRRSSESAVHVIPLVLIVCGIVLWVFSHPGDDGSLILCSRFDLFLRSEMVMRLFFEWIDYGWWGCG